mmetsp:Transcript_29315/g.46518  ORF Transcript_29315/g.46518 Transcript_29315/m.46518 type:complete len:198 (-) Transcript_29315:267-860(-)|eukprot:CAMPEP_0197025978 /NCGR_PEP_ID=MMETSP1384-20130603/6172_1 /TAXON_ID=29189 /ORGANISM="Ammonia sp." /LENGTH=197 /DNA_ID=CAMNT_0042454577 /DNA_START=93 /DNA_END=686 /DNA_ORIENTATION=-
MIWEIATYPLILLGLFRGAFLTYQALSKDEKEQKEQLEYWVVIVALLFLFPWLEYFLSWFLFAGLVGLIKFGILFMVVASQKKGYGFLYMLIDEQIIPLIEPYVQLGMKRSEGMRTQLCSTLVLWLALIQRNVTRILIPSVGDQHLYYLSKAVSKISKDVQKELAIREKSKSDRGATTTSSKPAATSISEPSNPTDD